MVGGRAPKVENELLYRFEFPESPGALSRFLAALSGGWNVSLFHYRNHGSDFGRVLAGFQVMHTVVWVLSSEGMEARGGGTHLLLNFLQVYLSFHDEEEGGKG